jgi:1,4-dihydroxy-2-naphthoate octaprenyltransferase
MNQSAQPGAQSAMPDVATAEASARQQGKADVASQPMTGAWSVVTTRLGRLNGKGALIRPALLPLAAPPVLCAIALLFAQGVAIHWMVAAFTLASGLLALAGVSALVAGRRLGAATADDDEWSPLRLEADTRTDAQRADAAALQLFATRLGAALLALAALCALPVALRGAIPAALVGALGVAAIALYGVDIVRQRIAPLDEIIAPLCLGPGLVSLTIVAQGQRMNARDWLVAAAIGCMALAVIEGRRLRATGAETAVARRTLASLIGPRNAVILVGIALLASFACALGVAMPKSGLPGALLALSALPAALIGLSGLAVSRYTPARRAAANQLAQAYSWFGLALAAGLALTLVARDLTGVIVRALGG